MAKELPSGARWLRTRQSSVIARGQALDLGLDAESIRNRVRYGDWQRLQRGVYATYTGAPDREALLWAALLRAGAGATLSHYTAAERHGLLSRPAQLIHVTVPAIRNPQRYGKIPGVVVHRTNSVFAARHPAMAPPCTRLEDTVLDLIRISDGFDAGFDWVCKAVGGRLTTPDRLLTTLRGYKRFPARRETELMLGYAAEGILSWLELEWVIGVERPHGLPSARRQVRITQDSGNRYLDNLYDGYLVCVELDGRAAHPESAQRRDNARDRWNLVHEKLITMRFRVPDLTSEAGTCKAAAEVASVLNDRRHDMGSDAHPVGHPCRPGCPVQRK